MTTPVGRAVSTPRGTLRATCNETSLDTPGVAQRWDRGKPQRIGFNGELPASRPAVAFVAHGGYLSSIMATLFGHHILLRTSIKRSLTCAPLRAEVS